MDVVSKNDPNPIRNGTQIYTVCSNRNCENINRFGPFGIN